MKQNEKKSGLYTKENPLIYDNNFLPTTNLCFLSCEINIYTEVKQTITYGKDDIIILSFMQPIR